MGRPWSGTPLCAAIVDLRGTSCGEPVDRRGERCDVHRARRDLAIGADAAEDFDLDSVVDAIRFEGTRSTESWVTLKHHLRWWDEWCGRQGLPCEFPAEPEQVRWFIASLVNPEMLDPDRPRNRSGPYSRGHVNVAASVLRAVHQDRGLPSPTDDAMTKVVIAGAKRIAERAHGGPTHARTIDVELLRMSLGVPSPFPGPAGEVVWKRTKAWTLVVFNLNLGWAQWSALRWGTTLRRYEWGWMVSLDSGGTRSQPVERALRPANDVRLCPVTALDEWYAVGDWPDDTIVFRSLRNGSLDANETAVLARDVRRDLSIALAGRIGEYTTMSVRGSFAETAVLTGGLDVLSLMKAGGWKTFTTAKKHHDRATGPRRATDRQSRLEAGESATP
jgi:hypothetical protein